MKQTLAYDDQLRETYPIIVGCDEVGRGCLAGPLITAAVILPKGVDIEGVRDSKKINKKKHKELVDKIKEVALDIQIGIQTAQDIDRINILEADKQAMKQSIDALTIKPDLILIDGNDAQLLGTSYTEKTVIKGDSVSLTIGAASLVAKYIRDLMMIEYGKLYPQYGFERNAGYGTKQHLDALHKYGITSIHRKSFKPIVEHEQDFLEYGR